MKNSPHVPVVELAVELEPQLLGLLLLEPEHNLHLLLGQLLQLVRQLAEESGHRLRALGHAQLCHVRRMVLVACSNCFNTQTYLSKNRYV